MDKELLGIIISEIRNLKGGTMIFVFLVSVLYFILDFLLLRHYVSHTLFTDITRSIFLIIGLFSTIFLFDRIYTRVSLAIKNKKLEKQQNEKYLKQLEAMYKLAKPIIDDMNEAEIKIFKQFIEEKSLEIAIQNNPKGYSASVYTANYINAKLYGLGLNILIGSTITHTLLSINNLYFDIIYNYFNQS